MALLGSGNEGVELVPGVYSEMPEGWVVPSGIEYEDPPRKTDLIPVSYDSLSDPLDPENEVPIMQFSAPSAKTGQTPCQSQPTDVTTEDLPAVSNEYGESLMGSGTMEDGKGTVAGHPAKWTLDYLASAYPEYLPGGSLALSEYPTYSAGVSLSVCVEELDLEASFYADSYPFGGDNEQPTATNNASLPQTRQESRQDIRERYERHLGATIRILESVDATGWEGSTDLSSIPTSLDGIDEALSDPFEGQLGGLATAPEEPEGYGTTEPTTPEATTPSSTRPSPDEEALEEFGREYDEANRSGDWEETYAMLEEESQQEFTEEEWVEKQQALREVNGTPAPLESVTVDLEETVSDAPGKVSLYYEDGTQNDLTVTTFRAVDEPNDDGGPRLILSDLQVSYLRGVPVNGNPETTTPESTGTGDLAAQAEEAAGDYYRASGSQDWDYTYDALDSETQALFTRDEWSEKNQYLADNGEVIYHVDSVYQVGTNDEYFAVTLKLTYEDGSSSTRETYFVLEGEEWKHRFSQEETDLFGPGVPFDEWVNN